MITPNNIYLGDCYELIKQVEEKSIDCIYTDIPYLFDSGGGGSSKLSKRIVKLNNKDLKDIRNGIDYSILKEYIRVMKKVNIFIWCSKLQILDIMNYFSQFANYEVLVWCKTNPTPATNNVWLPDVEYCLYFREKGVKLNDGYNLKSKWYKSPINKSDKDIYLHPTIKPIELVKRHLLHATQRGGVVLDTFMGSGTTCKACQEIDRQYIGFEINEEYFNIAKDRLNNINAKGEISLF